MHVVSDREPCVIVFFGLGAVGASMLICLAELAERDGVAVRFRVFTIDPESAADALYHAEMYLDRVELHGVENFDAIFAGEGNFAGALDGASVLINAALPVFNLPVIEAALRAGAMSLDLASDIYNPETVQSLTFHQSRHDAALRGKKLAALINMGISPGVTNFLVGEHMRYLRASGRKDLEIESIDLFLLEDIDSDAVIFSWSPSVALDELSYNPIQICDGRVVRHRPFGDSCDFQFPHEPRPWRQYPLYQEELISLHRSFPDIGTIRVFSGGSEVELVKILYQLNLLSKASVKNNPELTVEAVVRAVMPGMKKPRRIEDALRDGVIRRAHFCAAAEIRVSEFVRNERQTSIQTVGLSFLRYQGLLDTPYAGATYVSYPTAAGASIMLWHTLQHLLEQPGSLAGVLTGEDLARLLPRERIEAIRRDLVGWDINLFESVRDAESS